MIEFRTGMDGKPLITIYNLRLCLKEHVEVIIDNDSVILQIAGNFIKLAELKTELGKQHFIDTHIIGERKLTEYLIPVAALYLDDLIHSYELPIEIKKYLPLFNLCEFYYGDI